MHACFSMLKTAPTLFRQHIYKWYDCLFVCIGKKTTHTILYYICKLVTKAVLSLELKKAGPGWWFGAVVTLTQKRE
jgi:hypothetical protein